jgi:uncharacterized protein DUF6174
MRRSVVHRAPPALLLAGLLLLAGCGADDVPVTTGSGGTGTTNPSTVVTTVPPGPIPDGAEGLDEARARWDATGIQDYDMTYREVCFCPETVVTVVVRDGEVTEASSESDPGMGQEPEGLTVEDLFDEVQGAIDDDAVEIRASYDTATGRPTSYWVDWDEMMADEEHGIDVIDFTVRPTGGPIDVETGTSIDPGEAPIDVVTTGTSQPASHRAVGEARLTDAWSCGFGFVAVNPERTVAVVLSHATPSPGGTSTVVLPDPAWDAKVMIGADLFRVDCVDLDLDRNPPPAEAWPITGGTLEVTAPPPVGRGTATAVAHQLTVVTPDGATITFADLSFTNDCWACAAG